jgi:hypothetical protein
MIDSGWKDEMQRYVYHSMASIFNLVDASEPKKFVIIIDLATMTYWKIAHYESKHF